MLNSLHDVILYHVLVTFIECHKSVYIFIYVVIIADALYEQILPSIYFNTDNYGFA